MTDTEFDAALVSAAFEQAGLTGWRSLSIVEAARSAGLPLDRARARFPGPAALLMRFGALADAAALAEPLAEDDTRANLFDLLMRRIDSLQQHREGMLALLRALPADPVLALALTAATARSMRWMLEAAGISATGLRGALRVQGLVVVWLYTLRAWKDDDSADLGATMAALDKALDQAERAEGWLGGKRGEPAAEEEFAPEPPPGLVESNPPPPPAPVPPGSRLNLAPAATRPMP